MKTNKILLIFSLVLCCTSVHAQVKIKETQTVIPTYLVADPDPDPYFFTGRTYQGAAGHIYPYPIYDKLTDERVDRTYKHLTLENEFIEIGVLPEIGGRIFSAVDKSNGYNFFYRQHVIRPALIGMIGSWISGGVEWNIPHHHRASSTLNIGYEIVENEDGSKTIWIGETELRQRLKWTIGMTLYPGKSYIETTFKIQNRTPMMQSFLYWANVSVHANNEYQVQFPQETIYGTTHSKTQYSDWPFTEMRGKEGLVDNSWWGNFETSNSTFAVNYSQDHLVGYDFGLDAGTAHWANHHLVPGKKFFLWGTESVWNEMLTEEDGAYLELMVGTYSDNQPDYSWLGPNEVRETKQYWYPIKGIGGAKNVTLEGAVNFVRKSPDLLMIGFNTTSVRKNAKVIVKAKEEIIFEKLIDIDPDTAFIDEIKIKDNVEDSDIFIALYDESGAELVSYKDVSVKDIERPHPADRPSEPESYDSVEELLLAAQRLEEFHNARVDPLPYYEEALKRDPLNSRVNVNLGIYYARRAEWQKAETYLQNAYKRLTGLHYMPDVKNSGVIYHTNPKDGEMFYYLGVVSKELGKELEAEAYFWKSTWYPGFQSASYLYIAQIYWKQGRIQEALDAIDNSIALSGNSAQSKFTKAHMMSKTGKLDAARKLLESNIEFDPVDFLSMVELARIDNDKNLLDHAIAHMGIPLQECLEIATFYGAIGAYDYAVNFLEYVMANGQEFSSTPMQQNAVEPFTASPLLNYMAGYYSNLAGESDKAISFYKKAAAMSPAYCFPSRIEEKYMLEDAIKCNPEDYKAYYYLGNLLYYYEQKDAAIDVWTKSTEIYPEYGMVFRNLGFASDKFLNDKNKAIDYYRKAIEIDSSDPKFFLELDILEEARNVPEKERLGRMEKHRKIIEKSDDAMARYVHLLIDNGEYNKALGILTTRHFRVWEGGQTVYTQFVEAHLLNGLKFMKNKQYKKALNEFLEAGTFPKNLETNELSTGPTVAKIAYHQGLAYKAIGNKEMAHEAFRRCIESAKDDRGWSRRAGYVDESKYFVAMSHKELGNEKGYAESIQQMQDYIDEQKESAGTVVDIYSKFGEDGSNNTIIARNSYLQGLIAIAQGDKQAAKEHFETSLKLNPSSIWTKYFLGTCK